MRFIFILFVLISSLAQGQTKLVKTGLSEGTIKYNNLNRSGSVDKFPSMNLSNSDSLELKKIIICKLAINDFYGLSFSK